MVNNREKIEYLRKVRRETIDPTCTHPLYARFVDFLSKHEDEIHYPRFAHTVSGLANDLGDFFSTNRSICETGGLSLVAKFFAQEGHAVRGTASDLRYTVDAKDNSFDLLFSFEVLEHIKDQTETKFDEIVLFQATGVKKYIQEMYRVLKPGGLLCLTTPNPCSLRNIFQIINYEPPSIFRPHVREYTKAEIQNFFSSFQQISYRTYFAYWNIPDGQQLADKLAETIKWNPRDRGDCHFFIFRRP